MRKAAEIAPNTMTKLSISLSWVVYAKFLIVTLEILWNILENLKMKATQHKAREIIQALDKESVAQYVNEHFKR